MPVSVCDCVSISDMSWCWTWWTARWTPALFFHPWTAISVHFIANTIWTANWQGCLWVLQKKTRSRMYSSSKLCRVGFSPSFYFSPSYGALSSQITSLMSRRPAQHFRKRFYDFFATARYPHQISAKYCLLKLMNQCRFLHEALSKGSTSLWSFKKVDQKCTSRAAL